jgi:DNA-directed RNA polymerase specialized sigma24 family protein
MMQMTNAQAKDALKSATLGINAAFASVGRHADDDTSLDLAQEAICNVLASFDPAKATSSGINGYAYRTGYNEALDYLRGRVSGGSQKRRDNEDSLTTVDSDGDVTDLEIASPWPNAEDVLAASERYALLDAEIADLTPAQRTALAMTMNDDAELDNKQRQNKFRAIETIVANLPKSLRTGKRSKAKGQKRK